MDCIIGSYWQAEVRVSIRSGSLCKGDHRVVVAAQQFFYHVHTIGLDIIVDMGIGFVELRNSGCLVDKETSGLDGLVKRSNETELTGLSTLLWNRRPYVSSLNNPPHFLEYEHHRMRYYCFATWILTVTELELNLGRIAPTFASGFSSSHFKCRFLHVVLKFSQRSDVYIDCFSQ